jgi:hypothetical protein
LKADALTPRDLFDGPSFQRPYVWNEEDQWAPLWADVRRVAARLVAAGGDQEVLDGVSAHFLGAVVLKEVSAHSGDVTRHAVIDGQQRMTTLQILLDAAHAAVAELGYDEEAEALEEFDSELQQALCRHEDPLQAVAFPRRSCCVRGRHG